MVISKVRFMEEIDLHKTKETKNVQEKLNDTSENYGEIMNVNSIFVLKYFDVDAPSPRINKAINKLYHEEDVVDQEKFIKSVINCLKKLLFDLEKAMNLYLSIRPNMKDIYSANFSR